MEELLAWGESIRPIAKEAFDGPGTFCPGDHCRFCKGKAQCRARAAHFAGFDEYANTELSGKLDEKTLAERIAEGTPLLSDADVGDLLVRAAGLVAWYKDLEDYATATLLSGGEIPGFKLVEGRSNRTFSDVDEAIRALVAAGYDEALIYDRKPKTLTELEKLLGKKTFANLLSSFVVKPKGKPTLAPESDKREAYIPGAAEFEGVGNG